MPNAKHPKLKTIIEEYQELNDKIDKIMGEIKIRREKEREKELQGLLNNG